MFYNILIGGAAGQGIETMAAVLEKLLKRKGYLIFTVRDYMSRVRGGHNFIQIRFGDSQPQSHWNELDGIIALNAETIENHMPRLSGNGFVICDEEKAYEDARVLNLPLKQAAKGLGNPRVLGNVALGAFLALFGLDFSGIEGILGDILKPELVAVNASAFAEGSRLTQKRYELPDGVKDENILINGNDSIALGALAAGCRFYSAYPMTPSTSIMDYLASKSHEAGIVVEQAEDEIAAVNMAIGASYTGVRAMTGTSGGGFCLMVEGLGLAGMLEQPLVIANIQRPGPTTGLPTRTEQSDLKFIISASHGEFPRMVIALRNPDDAFRQTVRAFNLADKYQIPVILLGDQYLADCTRTLKPFELDRVTVERHLGDDLYTGGKEYRRYEITDNGVSPRIIPGKIPGAAVLVDSDEHDETGHITECAETRVRMNNKRLKKMEYLRQELQEPEFYGRDDFDTLLLAWGSLEGPVKEAVEMLNNECKINSADINCVDKTGADKTRYAALIFGDIWPLPVKELADKTARAKKVINVEQNATGQLASVIMEATGIRCGGSILKYDGRPLSSYDIYSRLKGGELNG